MEMSQGLHLAKNERKALFKMLLKLRKLNLIVEVAPGKYRLRAKKTEPEERKGDRKEAQVSRGGQAGKAISGRLMLHQDGYGFVIPEEPIPNIEGDIFIPRHAVEDAMHGDRVAVEIRRTGFSAEGQRIEGRIVRVTEPSPPECWSDYSGMGRTGTWCCRMTRAFIIKLEISARARIDGGAKKRNSGSPRRKKRRHAGGGFRGFPSGRDRRQASTRIAHQFRIHDGPSNSGSRGSRRPRVVASSAAANPSFFLSAAVNSLPWRNFHLMMNARVIRQHHVPVRPIPE